MLDWVASRVVMSIGALGMAALFVGFHHVLTDVPDQAGLDLHARRLAEPILEIAGASGEARVVLAFGEVAEGAVRLPRTFDGKAYGLTLARDALLVTQGDAIARASLGAPARQHLWSASNADSYTPAERAALDDATPYLDVDLFAPLLVRSAAAAGGERHVHLAQLDVHVEPPLLRVAADGSYGGSPEALRVALLDAFGAPLPDERVELAGVGFGDETWARTDARGVASFALRDGEAPALPEGVDRSVVEVRVDQRLVALVPVLRDPALG